MFEIKGKKIKNIYFCAWQGWTLVLYSKCVLIYFYFFTKEFLFCEKKKDFRILSCHNSCVPKENRD